jgi:hypothetical protein
MMIPYPVAVYNRLSATIAQICCYLYPLSQHICTKGKIISGNGQCCVIQVDWLELFNGIRPFRKVRVC